MARLYTYKQFLSETFHPEEMVELVADINILESIVKEKTTTVTTGSGCRGYGISHI